MNTQGVPRLWWRGGERCEGGRHWRHLFPSAQLSCLSSVEEMFAQSSMDWAWFSRISYWPKMHHSVFVWLAAVALGLVYGHDTLFDGRWCLFCYICTYMEIHGHGRSFIFMVKAVVSQLLLYQSIMKVHCYFFLYNHFMNFMVVCLNSWWTPLNNI